MRRPSTLPGNFWFDEYFESLNEFTFSGGSDLDALRDAGRDLGYILEREPEYAPETRQLALHFAMSHWHAGAPDVVADVVRVGLDADLFDPNLQEEPATAVLLLVFLAESQLLGGERLEGLSTLDDVTERVGNSSGDIVLELARGRAALLRAELEELDCEVERARDAFRAARVAVGPLLANQGQSAQAMEMWTLQVFGPVDDTISSQLKGIKGLALQQVEDTYVRALMGLMRTFTGSQDELRSLLREVREAIDRHGLSRWMHPMLLCRTLALLPPDEAESSGRYFADAADRSLEALAAKGLTEDLDADIIEALQLFSTRDDRKKQKRDAWEIAIGIAVAQALEREGDPNGASAQYREIARLSLQSQLAVPQAFAFGALAAFAVRYARDRNFAERMVDVFLTLLEGARQSDPEAFVDLRLRALFDGFVAYVTRWELTLRQQLQTEKSRRRASVLLDLLRVREIPPVLLLADPAQKVHERSPLIKGLETITDTLDRISRRLAETTGTVALVTLQARGQVFLLIDTSGISVHVADTSFDSAIAALADAADLVAFQASAGLSQADIDELVEPARTAYGALPLAVRRALEGADTVLIAEDLHGLSHEMPYELLHDGTGYLLSTRVLARFTSLRHMARTLDTPRVQPRQRRALVAAASEGVPGKPLPMAVAECAAVRDQLQAAGFDAPQIAEDRLSANFLTQRLSFVDVLHFVAHGESTAGTEYVILPQARRMTVDDLLAHRQRLMPFAYLASCQLGRARYLGGGQARGIAFTLAELGSPAVIASTTDILDDVSFDVASAFYEAARSEAVGVALLAARQQLIEHGSHPALVARIIIYGDPWYKLLDGPNVDKDLVADPATALLDAFFGQSERKTRSASWEQATRMIRDGTADHRLLAAFGLVQSASEHQSRKVPLPIEERLAELEQEIALADELRNGPSQAMLRLLRADLLDDQAGDKRSFTYLRDAIVYMDALRDLPGPWPQLLLKLRARLARRKLAGRGLEIERLGPRSDVPDEAREGVMDVVLATQQAAEDSYGGPVRPRPRENSVGDVAWNAVVLGHPNRFEDLAEASAFCRLTARKLVDRGYLASGQEQLAQVMLTGLLWFLWSSQKVTFLEPELVEGQSGTVLAMLQDIAGLSESAEPWAEVRDFPGQVDQALAHLDALPAARREEEVEQTMAGLVSRAHHILDNVASQSAQTALAGCAAFVTGTFAVKNRYSQFYGEDLYSKLTEAVWDLTHENETRFASYLSKGFEFVRMDEADELFRWQASG